MDKPIFKDSKEMVNIIDRLNKDQTRNIASISVKKES